ncbi:hypothetical protein VTK73DRAFT_540 [Phialemonium thermophilum]|uniref:Uncharacterized protein n=1 Tax=Phialemonium thermophilum TaxID=223376 RepID=A0ABR3XEZ9_9PEZI
MRQWGSSLDHNGMSFFTAIVPEGVSVYHGTHQREAIDGMEWLAFEIEHAKGFSAVRRRRGTDLLDGRLADTTGDQVTFPVETEAGYLHVYRMTRHQSFLYLDGMAAAKSTLGTLDTQDILLRNTTGIYPVWPELERAKELCELVSTWGLDGVIRLEAGFEIIKCNFSDGMKLESNSRVASWSNPSSLTVTSNSNLATFEYLRAVTQRYWGIGGSRVIVDFSSMISAFFYPLNLTNPDHRYPEHPRLLEPSWQELAQVKADIAEVVSRSKALHSHSVQTSTNWQDVTDLVVSRYSDRLKFIREKVTMIEDIEIEVAGLLDPFIDYSEAEPDLLTNSYMPLFIK